MIRFDLGRLVRRSRRSASVVVALTVAALVGREHLTRAQTSRAKLTSILADVANAVRQDDPSSPPVQTTQVAATSLPKSVQDAMHLRSLRYSESGAVETYVLLNDVGANTLQSLANAGATVQITDAAHFRVQAAIPANRLTAVAALPGVDFVRLPDYAVRHTGSVTTEGDAILHADAARSQFNLDGTGVKVGVISDGLKGVFATGCTTNCAGVANGPISTGDLPSATGTRSAAGKLTASSGGIAGQTFTSNSDLEGLTPGCAFAGAGAEGTALLEIVHDLAPAASLAFANADTTLAFNQAVNALAAGNDVVVDDLGFFVPPYDGTNAVSANTSAALNANSNRIRAYITSNGNEADEHYLGGYVDSGVDGKTISGISNSGHLHLFQSSSSTTDVLNLGSQPFNVIQMASGGTVHIALSWNDPAGASANNYDLYLVRQSNNTVVASATDVQNGHIDPMEFLDFTNSGAADFFHIVVQNVGNAAAARNLNIFSFQGECDADGPKLLASPRHERLNFNTASGSMLAQSDAGGSPVSVISVGAICSASSKVSGSSSESCQDPSHSTAEFYSSRGPTQDGRVKPDISAIDGVSITGAGSFENPFFGTSAAAPHVAGEAALILQATTCLTQSDTFGLDAPTSRAKLRNLIISSADARSSSPPDNVFGAGLANVQKAIQASLPVFSGQSAITVSANAAGGARLSGSQVGFTDPDGCPIQRVSWTGGCGTSPDSAMTCPVGTTSVSVAASNAGVAFSQPSPVQVTVTGFSIASTPSSATVTAGSAGHYQLNVTPQSGPFTNAITLSCSGLPQGAACAFSPASITPGATTAQAALTISTTGKSSTSALALPMPLAPATTSGLSLDLAARSTPSAQGLLVLFGFALLAAGVVAATLVGATPDRRRMTVAAMSAVIAAFALQIACGSKSTTGSSTTVATNPSSLTFASQSTSTTSPPQVVTLTNTGSSALTVTGISASGDFSETNNCGTTVAAGAGCQITVTFTPISAGSRTGTLSIVDTATGSPQKVSLTGTGVSSSGQTPTGSFQVTINGTAGTFVSTGQATLIVQ
jgi:hypothetical protein